MTKKEFDEKNKLIDLETETNHRLLRLEYAFSNNLNNVNDVIKDHIGSGKIMEIKATKVYGKIYGECLYLCLELKKDGNPKKNNDTRWIYQSNLVEVVK